MPWRVQLVVDNDELVARYLSARDHAYRKGNPAHHADVEADNAARELVRAQGLLIRKLLQRGEP